MKEPISPGDLWTHKHNLCLMLLDTRAFSTALLTGPLPSPEVWDKHSYQKDICLSPAVWPTSSQFKKLKTYKAFANLSCGHPDSPFFYFSSMIFNVLGPRLTTTCPVGQQGISVLWKTSHCSKNCQVHSEVQAGPLYALTVSRRPKVAKQVSQCQVTSQAFSLVQVEAIEK